MSIHLGPAMLQGEVARLAGSVKGLYNMKSGTRPLQYLGATGDGTSVIPQAPFAANVEDARAM